MLQCNSASDYAGAVTHWNTLRTEGLAPKAFTVRAGMTAYNKTGQPEQLLRVFEEGCRHHLVMDSPTLTMAMHAYLATGNRVAAGYTADML